MLVRLENGKTKDVPVLEVTKDNYIVPDNERHGYHVKVEFVKFSPTTGERLSRPSVMKFGKRAWKLTEPELVKRGATIEILHDPKNEPEEQQFDPIAAAIAKERARAKAETEQAIKIAVAAALAEQEKKGRK